ncbi:N/A [soil metagenome]
MRIGDVAQRTGVSTRALRYYEQKGLLTPDRTASDQRTYSESAVERVRLIQRFFTAGLSSRTIVQLLPCIDRGESSPQASRLLADERERITAAMTDLAAARDALDHMIAITQHPTPEHCPGLRDPAWSTYVAPTTGGATRDPSALAPARRPLPTRS